MHWVLYINDSNMFKKLTPYCLISKTEKNTNMLKKMVIGDVLWFILEHKYNNNELIMAKFIDYSINITDLTLDTILSEEDKYDIVKNNYILHYDFVYSNNDTINNNCRNYELCLNHNLDYNIVI